MLSFDIRALDSKAAQVESHLAADDPVWQEGDPKPAGPVKVSGRLSSAGAGRYYLSGRFEGRTDTSCRRCLTELTAPVQGEMHLIFADSDDEEAEDPDVYPVDPRAAELDLRPAIREQWLLAAPAYPLCRDDCKGLCPRCGADLNQGACGCPPTADVRWDALRKIGTDTK